MADQTPAPGPQHGPPTGPPDGVPTGAPDGPQHGSASGPQTGSPDGPRRTDPTSQLVRGELVEAEVKPLDVSGIPTVIAGIVAWAVALVLVLIFRSDLKADDRGWWLWVTVAGLVLGVLGLVYCRRRWAAIQAGHRSARED